jgi:hypothetical protein
VGTVFANITLPDATTQLLTLILGVGNRYNNTFTDTTQAGAYVVRYIANDTSTHRNINQSVTSTFIINATADILAPAVFDVRPVGGTIFNVSNIVTVSANVTDAGGVANVTANITFSNSSSTVITLFRTGTSPKFNNTFTAPNVLGLYNISFRANDTSNNINNSVRTNFTIVDARAPAVFDVRPIALTGFNVTDIITISANVTDDVAVANVTANVTFPNSTTQLITLVRTGTTDKFNNTFAAPDLDGTYNITFRANDTSNNINNTVRTNFTVEDTVVPAVFDVRPLAGLIFNVSNIVTVSANVTDNDGIANVTANITCNWTLQHNIQS